MRKKLRNTVRLSFKSRFKHTAFVGKFFIKTGNQIHKIHKYFKEPEYSISCLAIVLSRFLLLLEIRNFKKHLRNIKG